jgi:xanthine dehydrogenase accessory factor
MTYSFPKLLQTLARGGAAGQGLVLATVIETGGSAPQVPGAAAVFSAAGLVAGTVGGGLLEARTEEAAADALRDGKARLIAVRLDADPSEAEGAICGGEARVLVDPGVGASRRVFAAAVESFRRRRAGALGSRIMAGPGDTVAVERGFLPAGAPVPPGDPVFGEIAPFVIEDAVAAGRPRLIAGEDRRTFIEPVRPLPRLIIAGAGHVGGALAKLGALLDFSVTVIDDRPEYANAIQMPDADEILVGDIGDMVRGVEDSPDNHFVVVTRGHRQDGKALRAAIGRGAAYVGMIGSRTKVELMKREFLEAGWATAEDWAVIHAPIGLDIGSKTVEEIAVSIAAELVRVRAFRREPGRP